MQCIAFCLLGLCLASIAPRSHAAYRPDISKPLGFRIYTNAPAGKQLSGVYQATETPPLDPRETEKAFQVPPGFAVRLFASEPEVVNPVAMTWDERGRLWVVELYEYPKGAPAGQKGRDRIKILEDTDADGRADKVTVFADGFSLATGLALGQGGVYLGQAPHLFFLEDTDGDDRADKTTIVKTGFGLEDRHELLNGFAWGPDGWLYMTHGVFTHSRVKDPKQTDDDGVQMDAALARFHPRTKKFEIFADGTSNPWGVDWNERGDAFVSACVIHHLFHLAPAGLYNRQGGTWAHPFAYAQDLPGRGLPAAVNWRHYRAAHAGIAVYQGDQWPAEWRGLVLLGNIHQSAINCDRLTPVGSTYTAEKESTLLGPSRGEAEVGAGNFLVCQDRWFRPVSNQTGPDGALWIMDWSDKYPCYQNAQADPEGVDRELGRIWRVVWVGDQPDRAVASRPDPAMNLGRLSTTELITRLEHPNVWQRRMAQRLITDRRDPQLVQTLHPSSPIYDLARKGAKTDTRLAALWTLHSAGAMEDLLLDDCVKDTDPAVRAWVARLIGERGYPFGDALKRLMQLARDPDDSVRLAVATAARQFNSGSLTVNTPPTIPLNEVVMGGVLSDLHKSPFHPKDPVLPFVYWMAVEPLVAFDAGHALGFYENAKDAHKADWPMNSYILSRLMRRVCDLSDPALREKHLQTALLLLGKLAQETELAQAALDGLILAYQSKTAPPAMNMDPIFAQLSTNPALADKTRQLAALMGDKSATRLLVAAINDNRLSLDERTKAIQAARTTRDDAVKTELIKLLSQEKNPELLTEAIRSLGASSDDATAYAINGAWKHLPTPVRRAAADVLVTRPRWSRVLLAGIDTKTVAPSDISATARRALAKSPDANVIDHAQRVLGRYRASNDDKLKLIAEKRRVVLAGEPDLTAGYEVAKRACLVCHKLYGEGMDVGPDLTGVGRSSLDALLHNIVDPNEVIGNGFETTTIETRDGRSLSGRVVEETDRRIRLLASGGVETVVLRSEIAEVNGRPAVQKGEMSLMPEGLEQMPDADFRNLLWYLLNPPQDNRPWTPALRRELIGDDAGAPGGKRSVQAAPPVDMESVALWHPDWRVACPPFEGAPAKLTEYHGRRNVLMTHPIDRARPSALEQTLRVPADGATLKIAVAAHDQGDWELRVFVNGARIHSQVIDRSEPRWKTVSVNLDRFASQAIEIRLENAANDWFFEFGYWASLTLESPTVRAAK